MDEKTKKRPFWKVRRFWGGVFGTAALALASVPAAPIAAVGAIVITTQTASILLGGIGTYVFGYGQGRADERPK